MTSIFVLTETGTGSSYTYRYFVDILFPFLWSLLLIYWTLATYPVPGCSSDAAELVRVDARRGKAASITSKRAEGGGLRNFED